MIDLIIPVYNNYQGLLRTLMSVNLDIFQITVVDDCSDEPVEITFPPVNYIRLDKNSGPGCARQIGLDNTTNEYVSFIDAGDVFVSKDVQTKMLETVNTYPNTNMFVWFYRATDGITNERDNRLHGKIYKRSFLNKYNITFCKESSYANEDVGFNRTCRLCTEYENNPIAYSKLCVIEYLFDSNSLTAKNNCEFLYKRQNRGLALCSIHSIDICRQNNIDVDEEIHIIAVSLYFWFIHVAADRPEFLQEAWSGTKIFYDYFKNEIKLNQLTSGNAYLKKCLELRNKIKFPINILRFADEIWKYEIIPDRYLT